MVFRPRLSRSSAVPFDARRSHGAVELGEPSVTAYCIILHLGCESLRAASVALVIVGPFATFSFPSRRLCRRFRNDSEAVGLGKVCVETNIHR
jgi:hypothetical protein